MSDIQSETRTMMKRSLNAEFGRMEEDFDTTRNHRAILLDKIMSAAAGVEIVDKTHGGVQETTDTALRVISTAMKLLSDVEKADTQAISLKLKQSEQEIASSAATKDRIAIVIAATAPGRIQKADFSEKNFEATLEEMFDKDIKDFELRDNPNNLDE